MFRRSRFMPALPACEWLAILLGGVSLGLLLAWLQKRFQLDPRTVRLVLLISAGVLFLRCVLLLVAYVKELRREEEDWAAGGDDDTGAE
jgi:phage shock protein PspC (stress-responsive transcriptional regulator)